MSRGAGRIRKASSTDTCGRMRCFQDPLFTLLEDHTTLANIHGIPMNPRRPGVLGIFSQGKYIEALEDKDPMNPDNLQGSTKLYHPKELLGMLLSRFGNPRR